MKSTYAAAILALFLLASPIFAADAASAQQEMKVQPVMEMKPVTMTVLEKFVPIYYADGYSSRGSVYLANSSSAPETIIYTRPSGNLHSFTFHPGITEKLYFVNANQRNIYRVDELWSGWTAESIIYTHKTYVRDIAFAFDKDGRMGIYFSEASGAGGDGKIYKLYDNGSTDLFYTVDISRVGGSWGGDFTFDYDGNLYLSSGNRVPGSIYKVARGTGAVTEIFDSEKGPIAGLVYRNGDIYYADWRQSIYRLDLDSMTITSYYTNTRRTQISDVGFREIRDSASSRPTVGSYTPYIIMPTFSAQKMVT